MALAMVRPTKHPKSGVYRVRRAVPDDLRDIVGKRELIGSLRTKDPTEARRLAPAVIARFDAILEAARRQLGGDVTPLTPREVAEIAGEVYRAEVAEAERTHASVLDREIARDRLLDRLDGDHGDGVEDERTFTPNAADLDEARQMLAERGKVTDAASLERLAVEVFGARTYAAALAVRRAAGDWSPDTDAARFPVAGPRPQQAPSPAAVARAAPALTFDALLEAFRKQHADQPRKTHEKRAAKLRDFARAAGHDDAAAVSRQDVSRWKAAGLDAGKAPKTVNDGVIMLRPLWNWAMREGLLPPGDNPFSGMAIKQRKGAAAPRVGYTDEEAAKLLAAARQEGGFLRWLPWVLAFTGCRLEEACGATREDVREVAGVWCLDVHPNRPAGGLKTPQAQRLIPLHAALAEEGFLAYVQALPSGSPLFPDLRAGYYGGRGETATKRYGRWVRKLGITGKDKAPAHSWRHRMADLLRFNDVRPDAADAILGHDNPSNAGAGYGSGFRGRPDQLARELAKVPAPLW